MEPTFDRRRLAAHRAVVWALLLTLVGTVLAAAPAAATADGSLTVHARLCPVDYAGTDYFGTCHDQPLPGASFRIFETGTADPGVTVVTGADGNANLPLSGDVLPGPFSILYDVPLGPNFYRVFCSRPDGTTVPVQVSEGSGAIVIPEARGEGIVCDFFFVPVGQGGPTPTAVPESGSLTIYKSTCPVGYVGNDFFKDCYPNASANVTFTLSLEGGGVVGTSKTDANGFAFFENLDGAYVVEEDIPGEFARAAAYCTDEGVAVPFGFSGDGSRFRIDVDATQDIRCDYYNIPFDLRGETPTAVPTKPATVAPAPTAAPAATTVPVTTLPSTGANPAPTGDGPGGPWLAGMLVVAVGALAMFWLRKRPVR